MICTWFGEGLVKNEALTIGEDFETSSSHSVVEQPESITNIPIERIQYLSYRFAFNDSLLLILNFFKIKPIQLTCSVSSNKKAG